MNIEREIIENNNLLCRLPFEIRHLEDMYFKKNFNKYLENHTIYYSKDNTNKYEENGLKLIKFLLEEYSLKESCDIVSLIIVNIYTKKNVMNTLIKELKYFITNDNLLLTTENYYKRIKDHIYNLFNLYFKDLLDILNITYFINPEDIIPEAYAIEGDIRIYTNKGINICDNIIMEIKSLSSVTRALCERENLDSITLSTYKNDKMSELSLLFNEAEGKALYVTYNANNELYYITVKRDNTEYENVFDLFRPDSIEIERETVFNFCEARNIIERTNISNSKNEE